MALSVAKYLILLVVIKSLAVPTEFMNMNVSLTSQETNVLVNQTLLSVNKDSEIKTFGNLTEKILNHDVDSKSPSVLVHLVKNSNFATWRKSQDPDTVLVRRGSVLFLLHRRRRQAPPPQTDGGGDGGDLSEGSRNEARPKIVTPVLPINGKKGFNNTDCMPWEDVAVLIRSSINPKYKRAYIDPRSCNMKEGLECLPLTEKGVIVYRCKCMLVYGPKAVYTNYSIDDRGRFAKSCFIPAGLGWVSECHAKSWANYGYPLPFGDPSGTNAEQAAQTDAFNKPDGDQVVVEYIRWNSIVPNCVPHAECRERGTYIGQRCQCLKGHKLEKPEGKCSGAVSVTKIISVVPLVALMIYLLIPPLLIVGH